MDTSASLSTVSAVAQLEKQCFSDPWSENVIASALSSGNYVFSYIYAPEDDFETREMLRAKGNESGLIGYACGLISFDQCEVQRVCVLKDFRKRGFGERLMKELLTAFNAVGAASVFLEVRSGNVPARRLYEKLGFREIGVRKAYYGDDDAAGYEWERVTMNEQR